jgi:hypothetical protein
MQVKSVICRSGVDGRSAVCVSSFRLSASLIFSKTFIGLHGTIPASPQADFDICVGEVFLAYRRESGEGVFLPE